MSWNVWNRPSWSFMVDMGISSIIMKSPSPKCYIAFWDMTIYNDTLNWWDVTPICELITELDLITDFDLITKFHCINFHSVWPFSLKREAFILLFCMAFFKMQRIQYVIRHKLLAVVSEQLQLISILSIPCSFIVYCIMMTSEDFNFSDVLYFLISAVWFKAKLGIHV